MNEAPKPSQHTPRPIHVHCPFCGKTLPKACIAAAMASLGAGRPKRYRPDELAKRTARVIKARRQFLANLERERRKLRDLERERRQLR